MAELLLHHGADVDSTTATGATPLMIASSEQHIPMVQWLLEHGASPAAADAAGKTAEDFAGNSPVLRRLLRHRGPEPDAEEGAGAPHGCAAGAPPYFPGAPEYVVGTFNIRFASNDGAEAWPNRCHRVADQVAFSRLDLVGMQEVRCAVCRPPVFLCAGAVIR